MENLEKLVNDPEAMEIIASKESSMWAFMYNTDAFAAMIGSEIAMERVAASETAVNVITQSIADAANAETVLTGIKEHLTGIEGSLPGIPDGAFKNQEVAETRQKVDSCVASLKKATSKADILISNIAALFLSDVSCKALASNPTTSAIIANNQTYINALFNYRATTYKYIKPEYELGRALSKSKLLKTASKAYGTVDEIYINGGTPTSSNNVNNTTYINSGKNIVMVVNHRANTGSGNLYDAGYYDGSVFCQQRVISYSHGTFNLYGFYNNAGNIVYGISSFGAGHTISMTYIPVTS